MHPQAEWSSAILREVEGNHAVHRGRAEIARFWDEWHAVWEIQIDVSGIRAAGSLVVALASLRTKGRSSGVELDRTFGYVLRFEDGLVKSAHAYLSPEEALEAVGLQE